MKHIHKMAFGTVLLCISIYGSSQSDDNGDAAKKAYYTADSLKSGTAKDVLVSFFQLGADNLFGDNKTFNFTTNPYEFWHKTTPDLTKDITYKKWTKWRRLNISFGMKLDSSFSYNGFASGFKFAIIDQTDPTTSQWLSLRLKADLTNTTVQQFAALLVQKYDEAKLPDIGNSIQNELNEFLQSKIKFKDLKHKEIKNWTRQILEDSQMNVIREIVNDPEMDFNTSYSDALAAYKERLKKATYWTIGISDTTYNDQFQLSNVSIVSEFNKGMIDTSAIHKNNFELNAKAYYAFLRDTLQTNRNLRRHIFDVATNLNWVVRSANTQQSFFEAALGVEYRYISQGTYLNEDKGLFTLNGTLRIRIAGDIWLPIDIKYDPKSGNLLGFLNVKANFSSLGNLFRSSQ